MVFIELDELPKSCERCRLFDYEKNMCFVEKAKVQDINEKPHWCPIEKVDGVDSKKIYYN